MRKLFRSGGLALGVAFGLLVLATLVAAQGSSPVVDARMVLAADGAHSGSTVKAAVVAEVKPGYHINDHKPTLDYLIPTEVKLDPSSDFEVASLVYPKGTARRFAFSDEPLSVYEGTLLVGAVLKISPSARPGAYTLKGKLNYQACSEQACLPPTSVPVSLELKVVPRSTPVKQANAEVFNRIAFN